jgi:hypothetical protein
MKRISFIVATLCSLIALAAACNNKNTSTGSPATPSKTSGSLERQTAARLIQGSGQLNERRTEVLSSKWQGECEDRRRQFTAANNLLLDELEQLGYIKYQPTQLNTTFGVKPFCILALTEEGSNIARANNWSIVYDDEAIYNSLLTIPVYQMELVEVTGVRGADTPNAVAEFSWRWAPTGSGEKLKNIRRPTKAGVGMGYFQKYDDGWRVMQILH